mmetsp:Transcript_30229/g.86631  ORF Transcript_30229/g.86631 Transcript_30229/m.86631 type:complete len:355 (+) Transcript_30229:1322-2386(+)
MHTIVEELLLLPAEQLQAVAVEELVVPARAHSLDHAPQVLADLLHVQEVRRRNGRPLLQRATPDGGHNDYRRLRVSVADCLKEARDSSGKRASRQARHALDVDTDLESDAVAGCVPDHARDSLVQEALRAEAQIHKPQVRRPRAHSWPCPTGGGTAWPAVRDRAAVAQKQRPGIFHRTLDGLPSAVDGVHVQRRTHRQPHFHVFDPVPQICKLHCVSAFCGTALASGKEGPVDVQVVLERVRRDLGQRVGVYSRYRGHGSDNAYTPALRPEPQPHGGAGRHCSQGASIQCPLPVLQPPRPRPSVAELDADGTVEERRHVVALRHRGRLRAPPTSFSAARGRYMGPEEQARRRQT